MAGCGGRSDQTRLESAFSKPGVYKAKCHQAGVMNVAGSSTDLYSCREVFDEGPAGPRLCAVWVRGREYVVTKQARLLADAQGDPAPC